MKISIKPTSRLGDNHNESKKRKAKEMKQEPFGRGPPTGFSYMVQI